MRLLPRPLHIELNLRPASNLGRSARCVNARPVGPTELCGGGFDVRQPTELDSEQLAMSGLVWCSVHGDGADKVHGARPSATSSRGRCGVLRMAHAGGQRVRGAGDRTWTDPCRINGRERASFVKPVDPSRHHDGPGWPACFTWNSAGRPSHSAPATDPLRWARHTVRRLTWSAP